MPWRWSWHRPFRITMEPEPVVEPPPEVERKSVTAMLDGVLAKVEAETAAHNQEVQVASRRATNASRRVVMRTGMNLVLDTDALEAARREHIKRQQDNSDPEPTEG